MTALPEGFLFGCATSAYQVEGGIDNDWAAWAEAGKLKDSDARCGAACDHWNRWQEDFACLAELGANAYRFSISWARVEPEPGVFDEGAIAQYVAMIDDLNQRGIEPFVTLLHFTHPRWFQDQSPWHAPESVAAFGRFVQKMTDAIGDRVRFYTVINEPMVWLTAAYLAGAIPPGQKSMTLLGRAFANLVRAHAVAHRILKVNPAVQIGVANNTVAFEPSRRWHPGDVATAWYIGRNYNHAFLRALTTGVAQLGLLPGIRTREVVPEAAGTLDFIGLNYYSRVFVEVQPLAREKLALFYEDRGGDGGGGVSDLGWEIFPEGFARSLGELSRYDLPLYVTENGLDDRDDSRRAAFLHAHLRALLERDFEADLRGYLFWSLLDNFEWLEGFEPRFGIYRVDYATQARAPTAAARLFTEIARTRALPDAAPTATVRRGVARTPVG